MSNNKEHSPQHEELLKKQALEQQEVKEVLVFIQKYVKPAAIVLVVVCALFLADRFFKSTRLKKEAKADAALSQALTATDFQAVIDNYGSTPSAPLAKMGLALEKFNAGQIGEAEELYNAFVKKHGRHELVPQAKLNAIRCQEAAGQLDDAQRLYGEFAAKHKESHLAPMAMLSKAQCLEKLGQPGNAKIAYEDVIVNFPKSGWAQMAEAGLAKVADKK